MYVKGDRLQIVFSLFAAGSKVGRTQQWRMHVSKQDHVKQDWEVVDRSDDTSEDEWVCFLCGEEDNVFDIDTGTDLFKLNCKENNNTK
jgi:hypothetical protein